MFKIDIKNETGFVAKNAITNGGDAARVGGGAGGQVRTLLNKSVNFYRRGDASPPLVLEFCVA